MDKDIHMLRSEIDNIDIEILKLIEKRVVVVKKVGKLKHKETSKIYVPEREEEIFKKLSKLSENLEKEKIRGIYTEIISACRDFEKRFTVLCQGELAILICYKIFGSIVNIIKVEKKENIYYNRKKYNFILIDKIEFEYHGSLLLPNESIISEIKWRVENNNFEYLLIEILEEDKIDRNRILNKITFNGGYYE
ncbi:MAG: chorismate mutase [Fusobacteriaceae bacterium]